MDGHIANMSESAFGRARKVSERVTSLLSLRARLTMFALVCAVPLLALAALQLRTSSEQAYKIAVEAAASLADTTRNRLEQDLLSAELLSLGLGATVRAGGEPVCGTTLATVLAAAGPRVTNIILVSSDGIVKCSARPSAAVGTSVSDRPHMIRALESRRPTVSDFVIGRVTGQQNLQLVVPILGAGGEVLAFVVVGLAATELLSGITMEPSLKQSLMLFDMHGVIVSVSPKMSAPVAGDDLSGSPMFQRRQETEGVRKVRLDGGERLSFSRPVRLRGETVGWLESGSNLDAVERAARAFQLRDLLLVLMIAAGVVALAGLAARPMVLSRYRHIFAVASRVTQGDYAPRIPIHVNDDVTPVEAAMNRMLDAIATDAARLAEKESRYRLLFENNLDAVLETMPDGRVLNANAAALNLLQIDLEALRARKREALVDTSDPRLRSLLAERDRTGQARGGLRFRRADGSTFEAEVSSNVYTDLHGQKVTCMVFRDITQQLEDQARIVQLNADLEDRVRLRTRELEHSNAELEAFAYAVSHDLRSPVTTMQGFASQLKERGLVTDPKGVHYLDRIIVGSKKMDQLIGGLLALAQISHGELRLATLDITALAVETAEECRDANPSFRHVDVRVQDGLIAFGDRRLVQSVLSNLIRNALKFSGQRDQPVIEVMSAEPEADGSPVFCVRDNGVGFDEAQAGQLFTAFHRLHHESEFPGTGIGLATVHRIVRRHGGRVWARSALGEGASFFFSLPARAAHPS